MIDQESVLWGIHVVGEDGDDVFLKHNHIGIGWKEAGDLRQVSGDRASFKGHLAEAYSGQKNGWIINSASQLFRFVHEMKQGDNIVYRSKYDRQIHIGKVTGEYRFDPVTSSRYPQLRTVKWISHHPLTLFSAGALHELGSALTLFQLKNYADEFQSALSGKAQPQPVEADETVSMVSEEIEQTTRDYILKQLAQHLKGYPFQSFVANLLGTMGYRTQESPAGTDGGIDIVAHKDELKLEPPIIKVQVKSSEGSVGDRAVRELYANVQNGEYGLVLALGTFNNKAVEFSKGRPNLRLIDGDELITLVLAHYDQLDPKYKALLRLKRIYIPEPTTEQQWAEPTARTATAKN